MGVKERRLVGAGEEELVEAWLFSGQSVVGMWLECGVVWYCS